MPITYGPGIHDGIPNEVYHGQLCDEPTLSSTGAKTLIWKCPRKYWAGSYLNPNRKPVNKREFDVGSAAHLIGLEPHLFDAKTMIIQGYTKDNRPSEGYATADAKAQRAAAYEAGLIPILTSEYNMLMAMKQELMTDEIASVAFANGVPERSLIARDPETGVLMKCRPDWSPGACLENLSQPPNPNLIIDYKTTTDANPFEWGRQVFNLGYYMSAAWYWDIHTLVYGEEPDGFWHIVQEKDEDCPLVCSIRISMDDIEDGRKLNRHALRIFAQCMETGKWPGYRDPRAPHRDTGFMASMPSWAKRTIEEKIAMLEYGMAVERDYIDAKSAAEQAAAE